MQINDLYENKVAKVTKSLWTLANGPFNLLTKYYKGCMVNEVRFHTKDHEVRRRTQNSGLVVEGDHNGSMIEFFGFLSNVVELTYLGDRTVVLFQYCFNASGMILVVVLGNGELYRMISTTLALTRGLAGISKIRLCCQFMRSKSFMLMIPSWEIIGK